MSEINDDTLELTEINVEVIPMEGNSGSAVLVHGVIPEATESLIEALLGYCVSMGLNSGIDVEKLFSEAMELNPPRDPSKLH